MQKNYYLTRSEQRIFNTIKYASIVDILDVKNLFPELSQQMIYKIFSDLEKKGYLYRIKKGLYLIQDIRSDKQPLIKDPFKIALNLFKGYIAFSSALRVYGLIEYQPFTIFIATHNKSQEIKIGEYTIKAVNIGEKARSITLYNELYVSTLPKTFFDCFYKPQYSGGYETLTKALYQVKRLDWHEFLVYFNSASSSLCQRTGYILDLLKKETGIKIPHYVIEYFKGRINVKTKLVPMLPSRGVYISKWKLIDNLGKNRILGWL